MYDIHMQGSIWCGSLRAVLPVARTPSSAYLMSIFLSPKLNRLRLIHTSKYLEFVNFIYWIFGDKFRNLPSLLSLQVYIIVVTGIHLSWEIMVATCLFKYSVPLWVASGVASQSHLYMTRFCNVEWRSEIVLSAFCAISWAPIVGFAFFLAIHDTS